MQHINWQLEEITVETNTMLVQLQIQEKADTKEEIVNNNEPENESTENPQEESAVIDESRDYSLQVSIITIYIKLFKGEDDSDSSSDDSIEEDKPQPFLKGTYQPLVS